MNTRSSIWTTLVLLAPLAATGCVDSYVNAAADFGKATSSGGTALSTAPELSVKLCEKKARFDFLETELGYATTPAPRKWSEWYTTAHIGGAAGPTYKAYCDEYAKAGKVFSGAVGALAAYGEALAALGAAAGYTGTDITASMKSIGGDAGTLGASPAAAATLSAMGDPLTQFADILIKEYATGKIRDFVKDAAPVVDCLLGAPPPAAPAAAAAAPAAPAAPTAAPTKCPTFASKGLQPYIRALQGEVGVVDRQQTQVMDKIAARLFPPPPAPPATPPPVDALRLIQYQEYVVSVQSEMRETRATLDGYAAVLKQLQTAHAALKKAAESDPTPTDALKQAVGTVTMLVSDVQALQSALATKGK